jgi:translation initiation factor IF-3
MGPRDEGPRANDAIDTDPILLIDQHGENHGATPLGDALAMAEAAGLDLVEVSPTARPPVCKILDLGKYKYQAQKKAAESAQEAARHRDQGDQDCGPTSTCTTTT